MNCLVVFCRISRSVFLETGLPYIGFGFVDNFVMLVAVRDYFSSFALEISLHVFRVKPSRHSSVQRFVFQQWQVGGMARGERRSFQEILFSCGIRQCSQWCHGHWVSELFGLESTGYEFDFWIDSLADRIERTCGRFLGALGINPPKLTADQWAHQSVRRTQLLVRWSSKRTFSILIPLSLVKSDLHLCG